MIIVLDLDGTLFNDLDYVLSGFRQVSEFVQTECGIDKDVSYKEFVKELDVSRSGVFDRFLKNHNLLSKKLVGKMLSVYRHHKPDIKLFPDAKRFLEQHKKHPIYIVTDGNSIVQKNKVVALGLDKVVKKTYLTWKKGKIYAKPSPYFFNLIIKKENVKAKDVIYIGDNIEKDFVGIKGLGFQTVRIDRLHKPTNNQRFQYEADNVVSSFDNINL